MHMLGDATWLELLWRYTCSCATGAHGNMTETF